MLLNETIVAISSPPGGAVRGIVRISGPEAHAIARRMVAGIPAGVGRGVFHSRLMAPLPELPAMVLLFAAPHSFTGQHVAELHVGGSPALLKMMVNQALDYGARQAGRGEFTAQAFFSGKVDLTRAEAIAATINATTDRQLRAAAGMRAGSLFRWSQQISDKLANILALLEANIDFSDEEDVSFASPEQVKRVIDELQAEIRTLMDHAPRWERLDILPTVVFTGRPNVGKSSLVNSLTGQGRAIVSPIAGTTRDPLAAVMESPIGPIRLVDVAGIELASDAMRTAMNTARERAINEADVIVLVVDGDDAPEDLAHIAGLPHAAGRPMILVENKIDLGRRHPQYLGVSAQTGAGLLQLQQLLLQQVAKAEPDASSIVALNARHRESLQRANESLTRARENASPVGIRRHPELLAADLRGALDAIGEISGTISADALLGRIFSTFCIGK